MAKKFNFAVFVHDFHLEVGHSNALIELLRQIPAEQIESLKIFSYTSSAPVDLFPALAQQGKVEVVRLPVTNLYPALLKIIFFHLWSYLYIKFFLSKNYIKIGIGVASLDVDFVNVQFIHRQWKDIYFKYRKFPWWVSIYKRSTYWYLGICEDYLFRRKNIQVMVIADFMKKYFMEKYKLDRQQLSLIYSSVNLDKFSISPKGRQELFDDLRIDYPQLETIDTGKPILLFVGAYERKGLYRILDDIRKDAKNRYQMIIVGQPESVADKIDFPENLAYAQIFYTQNLPEVYSLADAFIFPTLYEPFGLVITEAAAMGLKVVVTKEMVGASEILGDLDEIVMVDGKSSLKLNEIDILTADKRQLLRTQRVKRFQEFSWSKAADLFQKSLKNL